MTEFIRKLNAAQIMLRRKKYVFRPLNFSLEEGLVGSLVEEVYIDELGIDPALLDDGLDAYSTHIMGFDGGRPFALLRMVDENKFADASMQLPICEYLDIRSYRGGSERNFTECTRAMIAKDYRKGGALHGLMAAAFLYCQNYKIERTFMLGTEEVKGTNELYLNSGWCKMSDEPMTTGFGISVTAMTTRPQDVPKTQQALYFELEALGIVSVG